MDLSDLKFSSSRWCMVAVHGKEYPIKKKRGKECYYIQHATGQITVTALVKKSAFEPASEADYAMNENCWFTIYTNYETYRSFASAEIAWLK